MLRRIVERARRQWETEARLRKPLCKSYGEPGLRRAGSDPPTRATAWQRKMEDWMRVAPTTAK